MANYNDIKTIRNLAERSVKEKLQLPSWTRRGFTNAMKAGIDKIAKRVNNIDQKTDGVWNAQTYAKANSTDIDSAQGEILFYFIAFNKTLPDNAEQVFYGNGGFNLSGRPLTAFATVAPRRANKGAN